MNNHTRKKRPRGKKKGGSPFGKGGKEAIFFWGEKKREKKKFSGKRGADSSCGWVVGRGKADEFVKQR